MTSTHKRVQIQRFEREMVTGFVNPTHFLTPQGVELLSVSGTVAIVPMPDIKAVYFVRDFDQKIPDSPRRTFVSRPKLDGLWTRMQFRDGDILEGVMSGNLLQLDGSGFHLAPPEPGLRLFVPRTALVDLSVLGVVRALARTVRRVTTTAEEQIQLFEATHGAAPQTE